MRNFALSALLLIGFGSGVAGAQEDDVFSPRPGVHSLTSRASSKRIAFIQGRKQAKKVCLQNYRRPQIISERMKGYGWRDQDYQEPDSLGYESVNDRAYETRDEYAQQSGEYSYTVRFRCSQHGLSGWPIGPKRSLEFSRENVSSR